MKVFVTMLVLLNSISVFAQNYAITQYTSDPSGIPDGWPKTIRHLGPAVGPLADGEVLKTAAELEALKAGLSAAKEAWNRRQELGQVAPLVMAEQLKSRIAVDEFSALKLDALQSELVSLLVGAYVRNTRLLQLVTKAVAGTVATNNLTVAERALVGTLRSELSFGDGNPVTAADRERFATIRDKTLLPHYQLYKAAQAVVDAWRTNSANAPDPYSPTNLPSVTVE